ncbi:MAG: carbonic anhydrase [Thermoplasmata archaeon]|jgi:carbonic anhydrase|nr:carbonic anhydrase [Thermoplasmata archaeon]
MADPETDLLAALQEGNRRYVATEWDPADNGLAAPPAMRLAVVACMDTRHNVEKVLGLRHGDAKVIRNAGNLLDDSTLRSLVVACHLLGVRAVAILGHTKCGMTLVGRGEFRIAKSIAATTEVPLHEAMRPDFQRWLGGFADAEENVRRSAQMVQSHPLMPKGLRVLGLLYDNETGQVRSVDLAAAPAPAPPPGARTPTGASPASGRPAATAK